MSYVPVIFAAGMCAGALVLAIALMAWLIRNNPMR